MPFRWCLILKILVNPYLINNIDIEHKIFIEFGVGNYLESNTRFLLMNNNWKGLIFDGSKKNIDFVLHDDISWKHDITAKHLFITKNNINDAILESGIKGKIGILHIDIDGNDYWIWECIHAVDPDIVIMEYNSAFGNKEAITIPYKDDFFITNAHYSNLYFGASLKAMNLLANKRGYTLVCSNSAGNNAYFVKNNLCKNIYCQTAEEAYVACKFRQNRNTAGLLTYKNDIETLKEYANNLIVVDLNTNDKNTLNYYL